MADRHASARPRAAARPSPSCHRRGCARYLRPTRVARGRSGGSASPGRRRRRGIGEPARRDARRQFPRRLPPKRRVRAAPPRHRSSAAESRGRVDRPGSRRRRYDTGQPTRRRCRRCKRGEKPTPRQRRRGIAHSDPASGSGKLRQRQFQRGVSLRRSCQLYGRPPRRWRGPRKHDAP